MSADHSQHPVDINSEEYAKITAELLGLELSPILLPGVVENFDRMVAIAQPLLAFQLSDEIESASTFQP